MSNTTKLSVASLGTPRIGPRRELKFALEKYWAGKISQKQLQDTAAALKCANWARQHAAGVTVIPSNDFSYYDHILDTAVLVGAIPERYGWSGGEVSLDTYFAMARGSAKEVSHPVSIQGHKGVPSGAPALEMTKWFDTNYHYMVPELSPDQEFSLSSTKPLDEFIEAKALGYITRPVIPGPFTFLKLSKCTDEKTDPVSLLDKLLPVYAELLNKLQEVGATWIQIDEPALILDLSEVERLAISKAYEYLTSASPSIKIILATYFGGLEDNLKTATNLPVHGLHVDLVRAPAQLSQVTENLAPTKKISLGIIDGRNVWRADLDKLYALLKPVLDQRDPQTIELAPSCSLLHVPIDVDLESDLDKDIKNWLAFAAQKLKELDALSIALGGNIDLVQETFRSSSTALKAKAASPYVHNPYVRARVSLLSNKMAKRKNPYATRQKAQQKALPLPTFPTTTIGSFPQTSEVRKARSDEGKGLITPSEYNQFLKAETEKAIKWQDDIGIDVLVHGEFERNDMVQYFGEKLQGYAFTKLGWVQSYGSRCVRPPIIYGDILRAAPMTVEWSSFAQSLTKTPVKGMLTGPVTMLQWSYVRDDIPRSEVCTQIAFALRDEVNDLEKAGIRIIQVDEPALREGLPLRHSEWPYYLSWAVKSFRLATSGVEDSTQIHTHMCYSEFNDIISSIAALDADVISIETSRSRMELLDAFTNYQYPNAIGPGVYDIHSPRIPNVSEMTNLLAVANGQLSAEQIWVNPDCGLKTRSWEEVKPALVNMVSAAKELRLTATVQ